MSARLARPCAKRDGFVTQGSGPNPNLYAKLFGVDSTHERVAGGTRAKMISASVHLQIAKIVLP
jgi:hypothetical protein